MKITTQRPTGNLRFYRETKKDTPVLQQEICSFEVKYGEETGRVLCVFWADVPTITGEL